MFKNTTACVSASRHSTNYYTHVEVRLILNMIDTDFHLCRCRCHENNYNLPAKVTGSLNFPTISLCAAEIKPLLFKERQKYKHDRRLVKLTCERHAWGNVKVRAARDNNHAPLVLPLDELDVSTRAEMLSSFFSIVRIVFVSSFLSVCYGGRLWLLRFSVRQLQLMPPDAVEDARHSSGALSLSVFISYGPL